MKPQSHTRNNFEFGMLNVGILDGRTGGGKFEVLDGCVLRALGGLMGFFI